MGDAEFLRQMGQRIMARRKGLQLTQEELAGRMGVSTQMISNLELGKKAIRPENLARLCRLLEVSADFILTGSDARPQVNRVAEKLMELTDGQLETLSSLLDYMTGKK